MVTVMERQPKLGRDITNPATRVMVVEEVQKSNDVFLLTQTLEPYVKIVYVADSQMEALEAFAQVSPELVLVNYPLWERAPVALAKLMKEKLPEAKIAFISDASERAPVIAGDNVLFDVVPKESFGLARVQRLVSHN